MSVSIRRKLIMLLVGIDALLALLAGFTLWSVAQNLRQINAAGAAVNELYEAKKIRMRVTRQMVEVTDYLLFGDEEYGKLCQVCEVKNRQAVREWVRQQGKNAFHPPKVGAANPGAMGIDKRYEQALTLVADACTLAKKGDQRASIRHMSEKVAPWLHNELFSVIDQNIAEDLATVDNAYGAVLVSIGAVPVGQGESVAGVRRARSAISYMRGVDVAGLSIVRQMQQVKGYLLSGQEEQRLAAQALAGETLKALEGWRQASLDQQEVGEVWEAHDLKSQQVVATQFVTLQKKIDHVLSLKRQGRNQEALQVMEEEVDPFIADLILPHIAEDFEHGKEEIDTTHGILRHRAMVNGGMVVFLLILISLLTVVVVNRIIHRLILAIDRLKSGVERIGSGDMTTPIELEGDDELGALAISLNGMCSELLSAREQSDRAAMELKESNDDLRNFTYIFSHDLRAPLVNMKGFAGELRAELREVTDIITACGNRLTEQEQTKLATLLRREMPEALMYVDSSVHRMDSLINAILTMSRLGKKELRPQPLYLGDIISPLLATFAHQIDEHRVEIRVGDLPQVVGDRGALEMILANLMDNALKYLTHDRDGLLEISANVGDDDVTVHVRDNGRGIAPEDQTKIFDIFRRAGEQNVAGEGMGLAYVKTLVRRHGGMIWCQSTLGEGSTFSFTLPGVAMLAATQRLVRGNQLVEEELLESEEEGTPHD
ncbi:MAG TPA: HAMP domain-containing sensor histidine kinase [Geobacterales bacterium]|nr:HAMP domain-containing sensor histidine kinase [Geobacterales bacterium]